MLDQWSRIIITILASVLITGGTAYLAVNGRLLVLSEQFRYTQALTERVAARQEIVFKELDRLRYEQDLIKHRLRFVERLLKQPDQDFSGQEGTH